MTFAIRVISMAPESNISSSITGVLAAMHPWLRSWLTPGASVETLLLQDMGRCRDLG
jgi:hypothetical protein